MQLPDVPVSGESIIAEYHERLANSTAHNVRLTAMIYELTRQRDDALQHWQAASASATEWERRYTTLENGRDITPLIERNPIT